MSEINQVTSVTNIVSGKDLSKIDSANFPSNSPEDTSEEGFTPKQESSTKTILDLFNEDIVSSSAKPPKENGKIPETAEQSTEEAAANRTFLEKMRAWLPGNWNTEPPTKEPVNGINGPSKEEAISGTPVLEAPEGVFLNPRDVVRIPQVSGHANALKPGEQVTSAEIAEALSKMSDKTMEEVMELVLRAQLQIEQEFAEVTEQSFEKNKLFVKIQQKLVDDIYAKLQNDLWWADVSKTVQKYTLYVCAIANILLVIAPIFTGKMVQDTIKWVVRITSGILMGVSSGTNKWMSCKANISQGEHQRAKHTLVNYDRRQEELREAIATLAEDDQKYKDHLMQQVKRWKRMGRMILKTA